MAILYTIQKGSHFADGVRTSLLIGNTAFEFKAKFYPNCIYKDPQSPGQINKLAGIAYGRHHNCSARIGWRSDGESIEVLAYVYVEPEKFVFETIAMIDVQEWHQFSIYRKGKTVEISMDGGLAHCFQLKSPFPIGYQLFPYFGGTMPAPHEMLIEVEVTKMNGIGA